MSPAPKFPVGSYVRCAEASKGFYSEGPTGESFVVFKHWYDGGQYAAYMAPGSVFGGYGFWEKHLEFVEGPW